jgi:hypothetical protein
MRFYMYVFVKLGTITALKKCTMALFVEFLHSLKGFHFLSLSST